MRDIRELRFFLVVIGGTSKRAGAHLHTEDDGTLLCGWKPTSGGGRFGAIGQDDLQDQWCGDCVRIARLIYSTVEEFQRPEVVSE